MSRFRNLLVVDDDPAQVVILRALLQTLKLPHQCHHVMDGALAMRFLRKQSPYEDVPRPQLILLDLNMPGKNGREVLHEIKSNPSLLSIPVIMLSTSRNSDDVEACYHEHANAYISKASNLEGALNVMSAIDMFWFQTVELAIDS